MRRQGTYLTMPSSSSTTRYVKTCHHYFGHNLIGHNYIGHNYIGHNYIGHNAICEDLASDLGGEPHRHLGPAVALRVPIQLCPIQLLPL